METFVSHMRKTDSRSWSEHINRSSSWVIWNSEFPGVARAKFSKGLASSTQSKVPFPLTKYLEVPVPIFSKRISHSQWYLKKIPFPVVKDIKNPIPSTENEQIPFYPFRTLSGPILPHSHFTPCVMYHLARGRSRPKYLTVAN